LRVCLISVEIFAWGKYGGFGRATRTIGRELAARGVEVFAVVPRRPGQRPLERLDGITVLGFPPWFPWAARRLFRECDADVYHSCEPSYATHLALRTMPRRKHMVTCRYPRDAADWRMELGLPSKSRMQVLLNWLYESSASVRRSVARADAVYTIARDLRPKVQRIYGLPAPPRFLPTPIPIPRQVRKAERPTVCYVARLDRRKRPELFLRLAPEFPEVHFLAAGQARDRRWGDYLERTFSGLPNLELLGFVDQFRSQRHAETMERSWVQVNTATYESMPNSILEASAHGCALLSHVDPDRFASRFGYHARDDDFARGLRHLLEQDRWRELGRAAAEHVKATFETERAMELHLAAYRELLSRAGGTP
jgi:glycosyltransferase involved in cell wall biosynthesis